MGQQVQGETTDLGNGITEEIIEETITEEPEEASNEPKKRESAEESARAALEELKSSQDNEAGSEGQEEAAPEPDSKPAEQVEAAPVVKPKKNRKETYEGPFDEEPDSSPPTFFKAHEKEWFNKIPSVPVKRAVNRIVRDLQAQTTRNNQELIAASKEVQDVEEAIRPYVDGFVERGLTRAQGIAQLCLAQKRLTDTSNPRVQRETLLAIARDVGVDLSEVGATQTSEIPDISNHPVVKKQMEEINRLRQMVEPAYNANKEVSDRQYQEAYNNTTQELESVLYEQDSLGRYKYPELSQDRSFLEDWKKQVSALAGKAFGRTYREAGINAYRILKGQAPLDSSKLNRPSIPNNNQPNRSVSAAVSVRGRTSNSNSAPRTGSEVRKRETPEQSAWAALEDLNRG